MDSEEMLHLARWKYGIARFWNYAENKTYAITEEKKISRSSLYKNFKDKKFPEVFSLALRDFLSAMGEQL